jgi:hypothetical protein
MASSATSSISQSTCGSENTTQPRAKDSRHSQQMKSIRRGPKLSTSPTAATRPVHSSAAIMAGPWLSQKSVGVWRTASQRLGYPARSWASVSDNGMTPCGPMSAPLSAMMPAKITI